MANLNHLLVILSLAITMAFGENIPVDENGRISENLLLVKESAPEKWRTAVAQGRRTLVTSDNVFAPGKVASCIWKGYPADKLEHSINVASADETPERFFQKECNLVEMGFISYFKDEVLNITWLDPQTKKPTNHIQYLKAGEKNTEWLYTVPGHEFQVKGTNYDKKYTATVPSIFTVGPVPDYTNLGRTISEANKVSRVRQELSRVRMIKRVFTDVGFKKIKVPPHIWAEIQTYWYNNKQYGRAREEWLDSGFFVNWHEVNQDLVVPPFKLKARWQEMFRPIVEEWTNTSLEKTDIYGIRTYYDGAWLSNHVDREATHAASAIINVAQVGMRDDWEVHIWDIHGHRHRVAMEPGDALLYESARCMHGRPVPLQGAEYTNVFVHYRPVGNPKWYQDDKVGKPGPDITAAFDPAHARDHDVGWVGAVAAEHFPGAQSEL